MTSNMITGVILAGGRSSRMGEDKGLVMVDGLPLYAHIANRLEPQVTHLMVSSNQNQEKYAVRYSVIGALIPAFAGPLSGMLAALLASETEWVVCVPCDVPDFPDDLVEQLWKGKGQSPAAYVSDGNRAHPALCLLNKSLLPSLKSYLEQGERKVMLFFSQCGAKEVLFDNTGDFSNLNTPADVKLWQQSSRKGL